MTQQEGKERVVQEFKKRKILAGRVNLVVGFLLGLALYWLTQHFEIVFRNKLSIVALWAGAGVSLSLINLGLFVSWVLLVFILKCPACNRHSGTVLDPHFCPRCGVRFC